MTGRRLLSSPCTRAAAALWLAAAVALGPSALAEAQTRGGDVPTELWRTYPVDPHGGQAPIRAGETAEGRQSPVGGRRDPGATRGTDASPDGGAPAAEPGSEGAGEPTVLVVAAVGVAVVLSGLLMALALRWRVVGSPPSAPMALAGVSSAVRPRERATLARRSFGRRRRRHTRPPEPEAPPPEAEAAPSVVRDLVDAASATAQARQEPDEPAERPPTEDAWAGAATVAHALGYGSRVELVEGSDPVAWRGDEAGERPASSAGGSPPSDVDALRAKAHEGKPAKDLPRLDADALKEKAAELDKALDDAEVLKGKLAGGSARTGPPGARQAAPPPASPEADDPPEPEADDPPEAWSWEDVEPAIIPHQTAPGDDGFVLVRAARAVLSKGHDIVMILFVSLLSVALGIVIALLLN